MGGQSQVQRHDSTRGFGLPDNSGYPVVPSFGSAGRIRRGERRCGRPGQSGAASTRPRCCCRAVRYWPGTPAPTLICRRKPPPAWPSPPAATPATSGDMPGRGPPRWALALRSRGGLWLVRRKSSGSGSSRTKRIWPVLHGEDDGGQVALGGVGEAVGAVSLEGLLDLIARAYRADGGVSGVGHGVHLWRREITSPCWRSHCSGDDLIRGPNRAGDGKLHGLTGVGERQYDADVPLPATNAPVRRS